MTLTNDILTRIKSRIACAQVKHPHGEWTGKGKYWALGELEAEFAEVRHAVERETDERMQDEILDLVAVAIRILAKEYE